MRRVLLLVLFVLALLQARLDAQVDMALKLLPMDIPGMVIVWHKTQATYGLIMIRPGDYDPRDLAGILAHEACHLRQFEQGRAKDVPTVEIECMCVQYFAYEDIGYEPGMIAALHSGPQLEKMTKHLPISPVAVGSWR